MIAQQRRREWEREKELKCTFNSTNPHPHSPHTNQLMVFLCSKSSLCVYVHLQFGLFYIELWKYIAQRESAEPLYHHAEKHIAVWIGKYSPLEQLIYAASKCSNTWYLSTLYAFNDWYTVLHTIHTFHREKERNNNNNNSIQRSSKYFPLLRQLIDVRVRRAGHTIELMHVNVYMCATWMELN